MKQSKIIAVDLAKDVFEIAVANHQFRIVERQRLSRAKFARFLAQHLSATVVMESCGTAHYWGRQAEQAGHRARIIPAQYVRPYRRRTKTDRADCEALLEAHRCAGIHSVPVRSVEQQQIQQLHRIREQWKKTRTARINALRGCLRELGQVIPLGAKTAQRRARIILEAPDIPAPLKHTFTALLDEIATLESRIQTLEHQLVSLVQDNDDVAALRQIDGIGLLTSTALVAAAGSPAHFKSGRYFAAWLGITPREYSSGNTRYLGKITKQGDVYLRTLIIHGARSVLARAKSLRRQQAALNPLQRWAVQLEHRVGHNKAAVALANKLARICWAVWQHQRTFDPRLAVGA